MPEPTFEEGLYYLSFTPDSHTRRYFGVKQDTATGAHDVVVLPAIVTPEYPDQYGPTQWRIVPKESTFPGDNAIYYNVQTAHSDPQPNGMLDVADDTVIVNYDGPPGRALGCMCPCNGSVCGNTGIEPWKGHHHEGHHHEHEGHHHGLKTCTIKFRYEGGWWRAHVPDEHHAHEYLKIKVEGTPSPSRDPRSDELFVVDAIPC